MSTASAAVDPIITIVAAAIPQIPALVTDILALFKKYPELTPAQIASMVSAASTQADAAFADAVATMNAAVPPSPAPAAA